jgi:WD40 repeat protein
MKRILILFIMLIISQSTQAGGGCPCPSNRGGDYIASKIISGTAIYTMMVSPSGDAIVLVTSDGILRVASDLATDAISLIDANGILTATYHPDGLQIVFGDAFGVVSVVDALTGDILHTIQPDNQPIYTLAYALDGNTLAIGDGAGAIHLWHIPTGEISTIANAHEYYVSNMVYHPTTGQLIAIGGDSLMRLWDTTTLKSLFETNAPRTTHLTSSPDGTRLIASSNTWTGTLFYTANVDVIEHLEARFENTHADFSADGEWLLLCVADEIQLWKVSPLQLYAVVGSVSVGSDMGTVDYSYFIPNTDYVVSLNGNRLALWDITQAEIISSDE